MRLHAIILAALSTDGLSVSLTAKPFLNSSSLPNVKCKGKDNGESAFGIESFAGLYQVWAARHASREFHSTSISCNPKYISRK